MTESDCGGACGGPWHKGNAGRLPLVILWAGILGMFRGAALIVSSLHNMFLPVVIVLVLVFPGGSGLAYCFLARRVARGRRADLTVTIVSSLIFLGPSLLLAFFERERTVAYTDAGHEIPLNPLLDSVLYEAQCTAMALHTALLAWIAIAGIRLRRRIAGRVERSSPSRQRPSILANVLLVFVGLILGYLWMLGCFLLGDYLGLRGRMHRTMSMFGGSRGEGDERLAGLIALFSAVATIAAHSLWRRWWGLTIGILAGLILSFLAITK